jgi:hypothetical protein
MSKQQLLKSDATTSQLGITALDGEVYPGQFVVSNAASKIEMKGRDQNNVLGSIDSQPSKQVFADIDGDYK